MKVLIKKAASFIMLFVILLMGCGSDSNSGSTQSDGTPVPGKNLEEKMDWLKDPANVQSGTYIVEVPADEGGNDTYNVSVDVNNVDENGDPLSCMFFSYPGNDITIRFTGGETNKAIKLDSAGTLLEVGSGVTLILDKNMTLQGFNNNGNCLVDVKGGKLIMEEGSTITGNISNGRIGGVRVRSNGTFTMNGGTISNNECGTGPNSAGGVLVEDGTFIMNGGTIYGSGSSLQNTAGGVASSLFVVSGGVARYGDNTNIIISGSGAIAATIIGRTGGGSSDVTVYMVGSYYDDDDGTNIDKACYWVNGTKTDLDADTYARAIAVSGGKVYMAGDYYDGANYKACYWIDDVKKDLDCPSGKDSEIYGIAVSDGKVYITGCYEDNYNWRTDCYWIDGAKTDLDADTHARAIAVSGGKVYMAGYDGDNWTACYWIDGMKQPDLDCPSGTDAEVYEIAVSDGKVYITGCYRDNYNWTACYWIDGAKTDFAADTRAKAIAVSGGKVYMAGSYDDGANEKPCYWIDGMRQDLQYTSGKDSRAQGIAVSGGTVYTAGFYYDGSNDKACYWKGTERIDLHPEGATSSWVNGIALK